MHKWAYTNIVLVGRRRLSLAQTDSLLMRMRSVASDELNQMMQRRMSQENPIRASETEFVQRLQRLVVLAVNRLIYYGKSLFLLQLIYSNLLWFFLYLTWAQTELILILFKCFSHFRCESGLIWPPKYSRLPRPTTFHTRTRWSTAGWGWFRLCSTLSYPLHPATCQQEELSERHPQTHDGRDQSQPGMTTVTEKVFFVL